MIYFTPKTELLYKKSKPIDQLHLIDGIHLMLDQQKKAAIEVKKATLAIETAVNAIHKHLTLNVLGRLIYVGAGTSGRIGVQDGVELFPTFNWPKNRLDYIIAGGPKAIVDAIEDAEDDENLANNAVIEKSICSQDVIIGLAASGNTPFTCKIMEIAQIKKALTISISNNPKGKILDFGKIKIILDTKEEVIAGSTRLKAGTAQKICLNIISSLVMTKMGFVKNGEMINLVPNNKKLKDRKLRIETSK
jgi:N-acetylmuramic acid 6-phosphate etherase